MIEFIFCHGLFFDNSFWEKFASYFKYYRCHFIDLGYFNKPIALPDLSGKQIVGVGHSLGLIKLIDLNLPFKCLIGINSFIDFLGKEKNLHLKRKKELLAFRRSFIVNPIGTIKDFHMKCGVSINIFDINYESIILDLDLLFERQNLIVNTLIFGSNNDVIIPQELIKDNFADNPMVELQITSFTRHGILDFSKIYGEMMRFIDAQKSYREF